MGVGVGVGSGVGDGVGSGVGASVGTNVAGTVVAVGSGVGVSHPEKERISIAAKTKANIFLIVILPFRRCYLTAT
jgi:hypothetical protein